MKVYLINLPFKENFVRCGRWQGGVARGGTLYYPIWLAYATGLVENDGHTVKLVDAIAKKWTFPDVINDVSTFEPDVIVADTNFSSLSSDVKQLFQLKKIRNALTIAVGPPVAQYEQKILSAGVDIAIRHEFDFTLRNLLRALDGKDSLEHCQGISFIKDGEIIHTPDRPFSSSGDLDELPFVSSVYKRYLNIKDYFLNHSLYPMVQIMTGRGCPFHCSFCSWPENLMGRKYRHRSVENIIDEFKYIQKELDVKEIFIEDDTFTINKNHISDFCHQLIDQKIRIRWSCQSRATLDYDILALMKNAGCGLVDVGFESGSDMILKNIRKEVTTEQLKTFSIHVKQAKLKLLADFVIGFPGETTETIHQTWSFIKEIKPDLLQITAATPIPGTEFYNWANKNGFITINELDESIDERGYLKCIISYPELSTKDIEYYVDKILKDYYLSPSYFFIVLKNIMHEGGMNEFKNVLKSSKIFFEYLRRNT